MINSEREIRPEDFARDPDRIFGGVDGEERARAYSRRLEDLKRRYEEQEETKARIKFKRKQARKEQIPYSETLAEEICRRIRAGEFLTVICMDEHMPTTSRAIQWKKMYEDFGTLYALAVSDRLDIFEDEVVTIADDTTSDVKTIKKGNKETKTVDGEVISRSKLRIEVRFRHLKAGRPDKWGEQSTLNVNQNNDPEGLAHLTMDELDEKIAKMEHDNRAVRQET
jgi:hypothetical protein